MTKQQDTIMHNLSAELSVKTSLYLVFAAFVLSATIQILNFAKDLHGRSAHCAVFFCAIGAAIALLSGVMLLSAAVVRNYRIFPAKDMAVYLKKMEAYKRDYPQEKMDDPESGILETLIETVDANQVVNEKKARWIEVGTWLLFASLPFFAVGGAFAICAYFSRLF